MATFQLFQIQRALRQHPRFASAFLAHGVTPVAAAAGYSTHLPDDLDRSSGSRKICSRHRPTTDSRRLFYSPIPSISPPYQKHPCMRGWNCAGWISSSFDAPRTSSADPLCVGSPLLRGPSVPRASRADRLTFHRQWLSSSSPSSAGKPGPGSGHQARDTKDEPVQFWEEGAKPPSELLPPPTPNKPLSTRIKQMMLSLRNWLIRFSRATWRLIRNPEEIGPAVQSAWKQVKEELKHYWQGTKLLWHDIKTAAYLMRRVTQGHTLSRRERRQLIRTVTDVFRLVPFAIFVLIPFMELLLPVALKLFPNMLPSTFTSLHKREEDLKRQLQLRLHLASFLQDTMANIAKQRINSDGRNKDSAFELLTLLEDVREGKRITNEELFKIAKFFSDDITLDNIGRPQLVSMCKYMGLNPYGTDTLLRYQLRRKLESIKQDDLMIRQEGLDNLSYQELIAACRTRGMRTTGLTMAGYKRNLNQWLELSLDHEVPATLLIMSRALAIQESPLGQAKKRSKAPTEEELDAQDSEQLASALSSLDEDVIEEVLVESGLSDRELQLEVLERQNQWIAEELQEEEERESRDAATRQKREEILQKLQQKEREAKEAKKKQQQLEQESLEEATEETAADRIEDQTERPERATTVISAKQKEQMKVRKKSVAPAKSEAEEEEFSRAEEERRRQESREIDRKIDANLDQIVDDIAIMVSTSALMEEREMLQAEKGRYLARLRSQSDQVGEALAADALSGPRKGRRVKLFDLRNVLEVEPEFSAAQAHFLTSLQDRRLVSPDPKVEAPTGFQVMPLPTEEELQAILRQHQVFVETQAETIAEQQQKGAAVEQDQPEVGETEEEEHLETSLASPTAAGEGVSGTEATAEGEEEMEISWETIEQDSAVEELVEAEEEAKHATKKAKESIALGRIETHLDAKLRRMLQRIEEQIEIVDRQIGDKLKLLDKSNQGRITFDELTRAVKMHLRTYETDEEAARVVHRLRDLCEMDDPPFLRGIKQSISVEDVRKVFREADERLAKRREELERLEREVREREEREREREMSHPERGAAQKLEKKTK